MKSLPPKVILTVLVVLVTSMLCFLGYSTYSEIKRIEDAEVNALLTGRAYGEIVWRIQSSQRWLTEYKYALEIADIRGETPQKHQLYFQFFKQNLQDALGNVRGLAQLTPEARSITADIVASVERIHQTVMTTNGYSYADYATELDLVAQKTSALASNVGTFEYLALTNFNNDFDTSSYRVGFVSLIFGVLILAIGVFAILLYRLALEAEAEAKRSRLELVGSLSSGHSHAIASIVAGMRFFVQILEHKSSDQSTKDEAFSYLSDGLRQLTVLNSNLALISRGKPMDETICTIEECLNKFQNHRSDIIGQLNIRIERTSECFLVPGASISIILNEITANALHHSDKGSAKIEIITTLNKGELMIEISDRGLGLIGDAEKYALEPFFSTSGETHTGLGLSSCQALLSSIGGNISIKNRVDGGAIVTMKIPPLKTSG